MKYIISFLLLVLFVCPNFGQDVKTITKKMNFNKANSFKDNKHGIRVNTSLSSWNVKLEVETVYNVDFEYFDYCGSPVIKNFNGKLEIYELNVNESTTPVGSYLHGGGSDKAFYKYSFIHNVFPGGICRDYANPSSRKFYSNNALRAKQDKVEYGSDSWFNFNNIHGLVKITVTLSAGLNFSNIESIIIPGITEFSGLDLDPDLSISVWRDSTTDTPNYNFAYEFGEPDRKLDLKVGDSVVFKSKHSNYKFEGLEEIWLARSSGESKYYSTTNVNPGEIKPFLGYDAQVHGVAMRKYPSDHEFKHPDLVQNNALYEWYWIAQRRTDGSKSSFDPTEGNEPLDKQKHATNFNRPNFPIGGGQTVTSQRNSQREGYNMQYLRSFKAESSNYQSYNSDNFILGLDADEIVYLGSQYPEVNSTHQPTDLLQTDVEEWKVVPNDEFDDPIVEMVDAYRKNRSHVLGLPAPEQYSAYEILDTDLYKRASDMGINLPDRAFNMKNYILFNSDVTRSDDNIKAPGANFKFIANGQEINIALSVSLPNPSLDFGFDSIEGELWPGETQQNVEYSFKVPKYGNNGRYIMEYTHENELGMLTKDTRYYKPENGTASLGVDFKESFNMNGWGYNEITVYYQRHENAKPVIIAGKELLDVNLRFISVAGAQYQDFSQVPFGGLNLNESRGEGKYWYLRDYNSNPNADVAYGNRNYNYLSVCDATSKNIST